MCRRLLFLAVFVLVCHAAFGDSLTAWKRILLSRKAELLKNIQGYEQKQADAQSTLQQAEAIRQQAQSAGDSKNAEIASQAIDIAKQALANAQRFKAEDRERLDAVNRALDQLSADPSSGVAALVTARQPETEALQARITRTQVTLRQLIKSSTLDGSQRDEWEKEAEDAIGDAKLLGLNLTLDLVGAHVDHQTQEAEKELHDASRHASLDLVFASLKNRRDQLEKVQDEIKLAGRTEEIREQIESLDGKGDESTPELIYHVLDKLPAAEAVGPAKDLIDWAYTVYREGASFSHLATFNDNAEKYLEVSTKLSRQVKDLEKLRHKAIPTAAVHDTARDKGR